MQGAVAIGIGIGSFIIGMGWTMYERVRPPVIIQNSTILNPDVVIGGDVVFIIRATTSPDLSCIGRVTREFYTPVQINGEILNFKKRTEGAGPIVHKGETGYVVGVPLPPNMWVGDWWFEGETTYDCGWIWAVLNDFPNGVISGGVLRFRTKRMPFRVIERPLDLK